MCGIFGQFSRDSHLGDIRTYLEMLAHRGPDASGELYWSSGVAPTLAYSASSGSQVALGHRRLSIIDLSTKASQPMPYSDGRYWMAFNGEVYNYKELRIELEKVGCLFHTASDTEVVMAALDTWGPAQSFPRFVGMFALVLLDTLKRTILIARDSFGIKPLYFAGWERGLAVCSEMGPLLTLPGVSHELEPSMAYEYLRFGITDYGTTTMVKGIRQVPSAHWACFSIDDATSGFCPAYKKYWDIRQAPRLDVSFFEAATLVRERFLKNVELHLRSDVPVGTALSGGIDSSAIVCAIKALYPTQEIHTFSYIAEDARLSEEKWIDLVAKHSGAIQHKVHPAAEDLAKDLELMISAQGEPFSSTSIYAQYRVFQSAAKAGVKVMLDGQGADEMLAGYAHYQGARLATMLRNGQVAKATRLIQAQRYWGRSQKTLLQLAAGHLLPRVLLSAARTLAGHSDMPAFIERKWFSDHGVGSAYPYSVLGPEYLRGCLTRDLVGSGLPHLLRYEDRNSMAFSIESRVPFLTTGLAELVAGLPESYLIGDDGSSKRVFREAMRGIVPDEILDRKDKIGFWTPEAQWLRARRELTDGTISRASRMKPLRSSGVKDTITKIMNGAHIETVSAWRLINFTHWVEAQNIKI